MVTHSPTNEKLPSSQPTEETHFICSGFLVTSQSNWFFTSTSTFQLLPKAKLKLCFASQLPLHSDASIQLWHYCITTVTQQQPDSLKLHHWGLEPLPRLPGEHHGLGLGCADRWKQHGHIICTKRLSVFPFQTLSSPWLCLQIVYMDTINRTRDKRWGPGRVQHAWLCTKDTYTALLNTHDKWLPLPHGEQFLTCHRSQLA